MREALEELIDSAKQIGYYQNAGNNCGCCSNPCGCMRSETQAENETNDLLQKFLDKYNTEE